MANKQPWYHSVEILFTTTTGRMLSEKKINQIKGIVATHAGVVKTFPIEVMESEPEPGDPADLM